MSLFRPVRRFLQLDSDRRQLFLQACRRLGAVRLALRRQPFKELTQGLAVHRTHYESPALDSADALRAAAVGWAVQAASRYTPWSNTCLVQVLAAQRMLSEHGIPGAFYIGAAPGDGASGAVGLEAHAWLKCGDLFITGEGGHARYTVVSSFSWP